MSQRVDPSLVRHGRVNGRYFRENFAQGGIDLVQIIPELVTNADSAIALGGRPSGRIVLRFGPPDPGFASEWKRAMRRLRAPALLEWRHVLRCSDDGVGMDAAAVDRRLGALGVLPDASGQRGLCGRGLRDVWLAQGGGRLEGVREGRVVESWFFPSGGDDPYAYVHVRDEAGDGATPSGTRISVPLAAGRPPANARLRRLVGQLVQLRPVLEDPARRLWLELPGEGAQLVTLPAPEPDPERPLLFDDEIEVADRSVSLVVDLVQVPPGTQVTVTADAGLRLKFWGEDAVPEPNRGGWSRMTGTLRARVTVDPGARLTVTAEAAGHSAELEVLVVRHRASGWVSEIARKDEDAVIEAHFDPESGVVTVYEGRPEFKALERAARRAGLKPGRVREYLPYRMLEVEAAANAVYQWAAEQIVARRLAGELRSDPVEYAHALRHEAQSLRHRAHEKLMRAFLDPEVFSGGVRVIEDEPAEAQTRPSV